MPAIAAAQTADNSRALIVFAKQPLPGTVKTRLSPPFTPEDAAGLYSCMLQDTLKLARSLAGITLFIFFQNDPGAAGFFAAAAPDIAAAPQEGGDLGERMLRAFCKISALGFGKIAVIGSDSPDLPAGYVLEAYTQLDNGHTDVVFGPSTDGGYYLLALKRVHGELFENIAWSSDSVLAKSIEKAEGACLGVALLPPWHDLDEAADLERPELLDNRSPATNTAEFLRSRLPIT